MWTRSVIISAFAFVVPCIRAVVEISDVLLDSNNSLPTQVRPLPPAESISRHLQCVGWRATSKCTPDGPREPQDDRSCAEVIAGGSSGYCEVEDMESGERFQVMRSHCNGLQHKALFRCSEAPYFAGFRSNAHAVVQKAQVSGFSLPNGASNGQSPRDGIVMVVDPKLLASAYAGIRVLRDVLKCRLPIEIWFHRDEIDQDFTLLAPLQKLSIYVGGISFHPIYNQRAKGILSKVFAIYNSHFDRVLFLNADNIPVRDPTFLFSSLEFENNGAIFWPDFWHPRRTLFNLHAQSMVWELLDLPFVDMFEQESGQLLVDRTRHAVPLELVYFYAFNEPNYFQKLDLVHGDKDLFRLAWIKLEAPFHMIETVPAMAGRVINGSFCGMTRVQHDADGNVLFLHRNQHQLTGERVEKPVTENEKTGSMATQSPETESNGESDEYPDPVIWTHLMSFSKNISKEFYSVDSYRASPEFPLGQPCYGRRHIDNLEFFELQEFSKQEFSGIESDLRHYAFEATKRQ
ncbi:hypothetical protein PPTG_15441 [Phytophthora nicotianae INRA-310]|uniref:Nucleotide-diphospho-sugar transferase n=1 Tax=Phytophthora nicotianae (strain INRA-310) TaxID=761204 RepID=W2PP67_PHYN3|nr:hypothetical protein PPTG_15441 [Phytophthora nicotianae INRA-310]ETN02682.1 hypothetical protein PPTG_15441 [Phytophthora nicotianae INRA-310]